MSLRIKKTMMAVSEDIISNLPEAILHHILSFLDIKHVVQTCVLSKRWTSLWASLPFLNFNHHIYFNTTPSVLGKKDEYMEFVYKVLFLRDSSSNIHTIRLTCAPFTMDTWIHVAIRRNIQVLDLTFRRTQYGAKFMLPQCLLTCKSLVILKLDLGLEGMHDRIRDGRTVIFSLPESVTLPSLRALHLGSLCFRGSEFTQKLISNSRLLDTLSIIDCGLYKTDSLSICATQLRHLEIFGIFALVIARGFNNQKLCVDLRKKCKIAISAPMLISFKCRDYIWNEYLLQGLSSLVKAEINMEVQKDYIDVKKLYPYDTVVEKWGPYLKEEAGRNMMKLLGGLYNASSLMLSSSLLVVIQEAIGIQGTPFSALRRLMLKTWLYHDCIHAIKYLLENSYYLETFILEIPMTKGYLARSWEYWESNLCNFYHLRSVEMRNIVGCLNELKLLESLLKNATALEKLTIFFWKLPDNQRQITEFIEILLVSPRASPCVEILFF